MNSWDCIKEQWVSGLFESESLGNRTNNRVESLNQKIKQVIDRNAKFDAFAADLVCFLCMHRTEINGKICKTANKIPTKIASDGSADSQYRRILTGYAYKLVASQIQKSRSVQVTETGDQFSCSGENKNYQVTETSCTCEFKKQFKLPCKHLLAVRFRKDLHLFSEDLIDNRWTKAKYLDNLNIVNQTTTVNEIQTVALSPAQKPRSQQERFKKCFRIAQRIASVTAEYTGTNYDVKVSQLQELLSAWENGENIVISTVENNSVNSVESQAVSEIRNEGSVAVTSKLGPSEDSNDVRYTAISQHLLSADSDVETTNYSSVHQHVVDVATEKDTINIDTADFRLQLHAETLATDTVQEFHENTQTDVATTDRVDTTGAESDQSFRGNIECTTEILSDIANISLPPRIQKRGRPKGSELTVIGLPKKKFRLQKSKCIAFERMSDIQKQSFVLSWFVDQRVIDQCVTKQHLIQEDEVELNPDLISLACKEVDIGTVHKFFSEKAWLAINQSVAVRKKQEWTCNTCKEKTGMDMQYLQRRS